VVSHADLGGADLRGASLRHARLDGVKLTGAKMAGLDVGADQLAGVAAEWVDFSTRTNEVRVPGADLVAYVTRLRQGLPIGSPGMPGGGSAVPADPARRFFGKGDVLRNATLEFGGDSIVEIQSRFENCAIALVEGAQLTIGPDGVLEGCRIQGPGEIVVHGRFAQADPDPSIVGPRRLIVGRTGAVDGVVRQHPDLTQFGFERGCTMRINITRHR
jgi:uncharacterized protein YjbI with pentapeptide repeats